MKSVLISIQPKWCELVASGQKTIEVRKTKPKLETPFKVYIYCTDSGKDIFYRSVYSYDDILYTVKHKENAKRRLSDNGHLVYNGKVIGEFVCNEIDKYTKAFFDEQEERDTYDIARFIYHSRIKYNDLCAYVGLGDFYAWHISDLVVYDKPKELGEFDKPHDYIEQSYRKRNSLFNGITRPPQSWCYVEEVDIKCQ